MSQLPRVSVPFRHTSPLPTTSIRLKKFIPVYPRPKTMAYDDPVFTAGVFRETVAGRWEPAPCVETVTCGRDQGDAGRVVRECSSSDVSAGPPGPVWLSHASRGIFSCAARQCLHFKGPEAPKNAEGHANAEPLTKLPRGSAFACALQLMRSTAPVFPGADAFACSLIF